ncbi:MAG: ABC transporter permease [Rhizobiales bacterium]|nr:ABC transporter permease [Hyphomicrobiales bacterium]
MADAPRENPTRAGTGGLAQWLRINALRIAVPACIILMALAVTAVNARFLSVRNMTAILYGIAPVGIVGMGMALLLFSGRFDLSVGGIAALCAVIGARVINAYGLGLAIPAVLLVGLACGALNSFIIFRLKVNSFVATLGSGYAFAGMAAVISGQSPVSLEDLTLTDLLNHPIATVPAVIYLYGIIVLIAAWFSHTVVGRSLFAVGANEDAARYAGVPVMMVSILPFLITGALCAIAGLVSVGYNAAGLATTGADWPLTAIAGAVIGGVSITGGEGSIIAAFIGMFLIGIVQNALVFINVDTNYQTIILGFVIVLAVATDVVARRRLTRIGSGERSPVAEPASSPVIQSAPDSIAGADARVGTSPAPRQHDDPAPAPARRP